MREIANPAISAPKIICMETASAPLRLTLPKAATPNAPQIAPTPKHASSTL